MAQGGRIKNKSDSNKKLFNLIGLTSITGIDFKKAAQLHVCLGVNNIEDLYKACRDGKVSKLKGWGAVSEERIKSEIELHILWFNAQCTKAKKEYGIENYQRSNIDKEFLHNLAIELSKGK
jgi:DNA polymerase/3'-5' exonuclease PolX